MPNPRQNTDISSQAGAGFGIIDATSFSQRFPALAHGVAMETAKESGADASDPKTIVTVMHSRNYQKRLNDMATNRDDRMLSRIVGNVPTLPDRNAPAGQQQEQIFQGREQTAINQIRARGAMTQRTMEAQSKLDELSNFDRESYTSKRLGELSPTKDIDDRMLQLRMQAFTAKAMLRQELRGLPPSLRDQAISARMQVFADTISTLGDIKEARIASAKAKINDEIDSHNDQVHTAKARVSALKSVMDSIEQTGKDSEALASIRMDYLKEVKKLGKAQGSGIPDDVETLKNAILNDWMSNEDANPGRKAPTAAQIDEAERQAKDVIKRRKSATKDIPSGGSAAIRGAMSTNALSIAPLGLAASDEEE